MSEKFILVSLEDEKAKEIANIVSNDTCRKLLDYLGDKDASETDIGKALNMPLSTVHYNMQNLLKHGLVEIKDFVWSDKGNKINVYKIAKKFIVIAPKGETVPSSIKNLIPVAIISFAASALLYLFAGFRKVAVSSDIFSQQIMQPIARELAQESAKVAVSGGQALSQAIVNATTTTQATSTITQTVNVLVPQFNYLWFLAGSIFAILLYMLISNLRRKK